ncbi:MAG TPA: DNA adenine methylase, partial [Gemmatimonadaceae bacterium]
KWAGGKSRLLPELLKRVPKSFNRYFEPFVGGGALYFTLAQRDAWAGRATISDTNAHLINMYAAVQTDVERLIKELRRLARHHANKGEPFYYRLRDTWNDPTLLATVADEDARGMRAAQFLTLNKLCFNGLYRVNKEGKFNVSYGEYKAPVICDADNLRAASAALAGTKLVCAGYQHTLAKAQENDFVYLDPPYDPVSDTANFVAYGADHFGREQQAELAILSRARSLLGVHVMLSNSDTKYIRSLYPKEHWKLDRVMVPRAINSDTSKRGGVPELLITSRR